MKNTILSVGSVLLLTLLTSVWAADIMGKWIAQTPGMKGTDEIIFSFKADGPILTGTVTNSQGEIPISEGKINGDEISFVVIRSFGGNEMKLVYKGKVGLNEIRFTREIQGRKEQPYEFIAKREFQRHGDIPIQREVAPVVPLPRR